MDVIMPQLGETVAEGVVTKWYKKVGDPVKADELLFDVETDKVSTEIPAQANGVVAEILVEEGTTVKVGARLAVIAEAGHAPAPRTQGPLPPPTILRALSASVRPPRTRRRSQSPRSRRAQRARRIASRLSCASSSRSTVSIRRPSSAAAATGASRAMT